MKVLLQWSGFRSLLNIAYGTVDQAPMLTAQTLSKL